MFQCQLHRQQIQNVCLNQSCINFGFQCCQCENLHNECQIVSIYVYRGQIQAIQNDLKYYQRRKQILKQAFEKLLLTIQNYIQQLFHIIDTFQEIDLLSNLEKVGNQDFQKFYKQCNDAKEQMQLIKNQEEQTLNGIEQALDNFKRSALDSKMEILYVGHFLENPEVQIKASAEIHNKYNLNLLKLSNQHKRIQQNDYRIKFVEVLDEGEILVVKEKMFQIFENTTKREIFRNSIQEEDLENRQRNQNKRSYRSVAIKNGSNSSFYILVEDNDNEFKYIQGWQKQKYNLWNKYIQSQPQKAKTTGSIGVIKYSEFDKELILATRRINFYNDKGTKFERDDKLKQEITRLPAKLLFVSGNLIFIGGEKSLNVLYKKRKVTPFKNINEKVESIYFKNKELVVGTEECIQIYKITLEEDLKIENYQRFSLEGSISFISNFTNENQILINVKRRLKMKDVIYYNFIYEIGTFSYDFRLEKIYNIDQQIKCISCKNNITTVYYIVDDQLLCESE